MTWLDAQVVVGESGPSAGCPVSPTVFDDDGMLGPEPRRADVDDSPAGVPPIGTAPAADPPTPAGLDLSRDYFPQPRVEVPAAATRPPAGAPSMVEAVAAIAARAAAASVLLDRAFGPVA